MDEPPFDQRHCELTTDDGHPLAASVFEPESGGEGVVVFGSAMAVPRHFYRTMAEWFAARGYGAVTFDYRGTADSGDAATSTASLEDWMKRDLRSVLDWARSRWETGPLFLVAHSLSGQLMGLLGGDAPLDAAATFSAQSGYWRLQYPGEEWKLLITAGVVVPLLTRLLGYFPWGTLVGGENLPQRVALQWAAGCRQPEYLLADDILEGTQAFREFTAPILAYSFDDDRWGYRKAVDRMMRTYRSAPVERLHLTPADLDARDVGHFGYFREEFTDAWTELLERLERAVSEPRSTQST